MPHPLAVYMVPVLLFVFFIPGIVHAQKIIACTNTGSFISLDVSDNGCQYSYTNVHTAIDSIFDVPFSNALYKDTLYYNTVSGAIYRYVLGSTTTAVLITHASPSITLTVDKSGTLYYVASNNSLVRYNPHNNVADTLGSMNFSPAGDLVFYNDKLILAAWEGLVEVNLQKPEASTLYMDTPGYGFFSLINVAVACNQNTIYGIAPSVTGDSSVLVEIDMVQKKIIGKKCTLPISIYDAGSITETGGYEGVTINAITRLSCTGRSDTTGIQVKAFTASAESLIYILNNTDSNYNGMFYRLTTGSYKITVKTQSGCSDDTAVYINTDTKIEVQIGAENDNCNANKGSIIINNKNPASALSVSLNNGPYSLASYFTHLDTGTYFIRIQNTSYCEMDTAVAIRYNYFTPAGYLGQDTTLCVRQTVVLKAPPYTNATYLWQDGSAAPEFNVSAAGTYSLALRTPCGTGTDSVHIKYQNCNCDFYIPGAFSPNLDGLNDRFTIRNKCLFTNYQIQIFNRVGQPVYQSRDAGRGWDGNLNGFPQPAGTYIWKITYFDISNNKTVANAGTVVLLR